MKRAILCTLTCLCLFASCNDGRDDSLINLFPKKSLGKTTYRYECRLKERNPRLIESEIILESTLHELMPGENGLPCRQLTIDANHPENSIYLCNNDDVMLIINELDGYTSFDTLFNFNEISSRWEAVGPMNHFRMHSFSVCNAWPNQDSVESYGIQAQIIRGTAITDYAIHADKYMNILEFRYSKGNLQYECWQIGSND